MIMGVLNVTPDSFSDGGRFVSPQAAMRHAARMVEDGADLIDVGGESTRPGSQGVSASEELERVIPVIERLHAEFDALISIDTSKPEVMREAVRAGAGMINDVCALRAEGAVQAVAELGVPVCLVHMQGEPRSMQRAPHYDDVVAEVKEFLEQRARTCEAAGVAEKNIVVDPGFGFGKTLAHNLKLMAELDQIVATGKAVLVGVSRKAMIGAILGRAVDERLHGNIGFAVYAALQGAAVVRVHEVGPTSDALSVIGAIAEASQSSSASGE